MANINLGNAAGNQPEFVGRGVNAAICRISLSVTTSAGDVIHIGKLPHQAIPLDVVFYPGAALAQNTIHKFGLSGSDACFLVSKSYSTAVERGTVNLNLLEAFTSVSDAAVQRYKWIVHTPTSATSVGHVGTLVVFYKMPGQTL